MWGEGKSGDGVSRGGECREKVADGGARVWQCWNCYTWIYVLNLVNCCWDCNCFHGMNVSWVLTID